MSMQESALARRVDRLLLENAKLRAEGAALRQDAERYRWMRKTDSWEDARTGDLWIVNARDEVINQDGHKLDQAIDAAMSRES